MPSASAAPCAIRCRLRSDSASILSIPSSTGLIHFDSISVGTCANPSWFDLSNCGSVQLKESVDDVGAGEKKGVLRSTSANEPIMYFSFIRGGRSEGGWDVCNAMLLLLLAMHRVAPTSNMLLFTRTLK